VLVRDCRLARSTLTKTAPPPKRAHDDTKLELKSLEAQPGDE
jgi:hypothetical protein